MIEEYLKFKAGAPGEDGKATLDDDRKVLQNRILPRVGNLPLRQLTATVIARFTKERTSAVKAAPI